MKISIVNKFTADGREYIEWDFWYGPTDGSDHAHGYAVDLVQAFAKIFEWKERIDRDYADELIADIETAKQFTQTNDTDCKPTN